MQENAAAYAQSFADAAEKNGSIRAEKSGSKGAGKSKSRGLIAGLTKPTASKDRALEPEAGVLTTRAPAPATTSSGYRYGMGVYDFKILLHT